MLNSQLQELRGYLLEHNRGGLVSCDIQAIRPSEVKALEDSGYIRKLYNKNNEEVFKLTGAGWGLLKS